MQRKIIPANTARKTINYFLQNEGNRADRIALLNIHEVNLYIDIVTAELAKFDKIMHDGYEFLFKAPQGKRNVTDDEITYNDYAGYRFKIADQDASSRSGRYKINATLREITISPEPPIQDLQNLLMELLQQKRNLEAMQKLEDNLALKVLNKKLAKDTERPTSPSASDIHEAIKDGQDEVALEVLHSHHALLEKYKELNNRFEVLKEEETRKSTLLESALAQNRTYGENIAQIRNEHAQLLHNFETLTSERRVIEAGFGVLEEKLQEKQRQNDALSNSVRNLKSQQSETDANLRTANQTINSIKQQMAEYKTELDRLKQQESLASSISVSFLDYLLKKYNPNVGMSLFSSSSPDQATYNKLLALTKSKQAYITIKDIEDCIDVDRELLQVLSSPKDYIDNKTISKTACVIRDLALHHKDLQLQVKPSAQRL